MTCHPTICMHIQMLGRAADLSLPAVVCRITMTMMTHLSALSRLYREICSLTQSNTHPEVVSR